MAFGWARPTTFTHPTFVVGDNVLYYAVDHSPSYLWKSATWEISEALLPFLRTVLEAAVPGMGSPRCVGPSRSGTGSSRIPPSCPSRAAHRSTRTGPSRPSWSGEGPLVIGPRLHLIWPRRRRGAPPTRSRTRFHLAWYAVPNRRWARSASALVPASRPDRTGFGQPQSAHQRDDRHDDADQARGELALEEAHQGHGQVGRDRAEVGHQQRPAPSASALGPTGVAWIRRTVPMAPPSRIASIDLRPSCPSTRRRDRATSRTRRASGRHQPRTAPPAPPTTGGAGL